MCTDTEDIVSFKLVVEYVLDTSYNIHSKCNYLCNLVLCIVTVFAWKYLILIAIIILLLFIVCTCSYTSHPIHCNSVCIQLLALPA